MVTRAEFDKLRMSPRAFREKLLIDTDQGPRILADVWDHWQRADFESLDAGWQNVAHRNRPDAIRRAYLERGRGHSKTSDISIMCEWVLFASPSQLVGNAIAASKEQAGLIRDSILQSVHLNPWLGQYLDVQVHRIVNKYTDSKLQILTSDSGTNYGQIPDFVICDELTHWKGEGGKQAWATSFSGAGKRAHCMLVIISNAGVGMGSSWQWNVRESARTRDDWYSNYLDGSQASWISTDQLDEQKAFLTSDAFRRLWENKWTQGQGDAIEPSDITAAITKKLPVSEQRGNWVYAAGLDLGVKNDHSALVVLGTKFGSGRVRVASCESWAPGPGGQVDLMAVERGVLLAQEKFNLACCCFDPNQAYLMAQRLGRAGVQMSEMTFVGKNLDMMARDLLGVFRSRQIDMYPDQALVDDLHRLTIVERKYGYKLEAISDDRGHADRAIALAIALPMVLEAAHVAVSMTEENLITQVTT